MTLNNNNIELFCLKGKNGSACASRCPPGKYPIFNTCASCVSSCATCSSEAACASCAAAFYLDGSSCRAKAEAAYALALKAEAAYALALAGLIIGCIVGAIVVLGIIVGLGYYCYKKWKETHLTENTQGENQTDILANP